MERADAEGKEIDKSKWTIICSEQGMGDQVLFMHSMNEAIEELGKVLFIAKRMHPILKRSFPNIVVGCSGATYDWSRTSLAKMDIFRWEVFHRGTEKQLRHIMITEYRF